MQSESKIQFRFIFFGYPSKNVAGEINSNGLNIPSIHLNKGRHTFSVFIPNLYLLAGKYSIGYNILGRNNKLISSGSGHLNIEVEGAGIGETYNQINAKVKRY